MLTGKQKHFLRSRAMTMKPLVNVGKNGLTDQLVQSVAAAVEARELVKISLLQTAEYGPKTWGVTSSSFARVGNCADDRAHGRGV